MSESWPRNYRQRNISPLSSPWTETGHSLEGDGLIKHALKITGGLNPKLLQDDSMSSHHEATTNPPAPWRDPKHCQQPVWSAQTFFSLALVVKEKFLFWSMFHFQFSHLQVQGIRVWHCCWFFRSLPNVISLKAPVAREQALLVLVQVGTCSRVQGVGEWNSRLG